MISVVFSAYRNPLEGPVSDGEWLRGMAIFRDAESHGVFQARAEDRVRLVQVAAGIIDVERRGADDGAARSAGDVEGFGARAGHERQSSQQPRDGGETDARQFSHRKPPRGGSHHGTGRRLAPIRTTTEKGKHQSGYSGITSE